MDFDFDFIDNILNILKSLQLYLIPFAVIFAIINVLYSLYKFFYGDTNIPEGEESKSFSVFLNKLVVRIVIGALVFSSFPFIAGIPIRFVSIVYDNLSEINVAEVSMGKRIKVEEAFLEERGYFNEETKTKWETLSLSSKWRVAQLYRAYYKAKEKTTYTFNRHLGMVRKEVKMPNQEDIDQATENSNDMLSFTDLFFSQNILDSLQSLLGVISNWLLSIVRTIIFFLLQFLLYLDLILGMFIVTIAFFPGMDKNIVQWLGDHFSLLMWGIVFISIDWLLELFVFMVMTDQGSNQVWLMPVISILVYGTVAYHASRLIGGSEAGGGILPRLTNLALNSIPIVGSGMLTFKGIMAKGAKNLMNNFKKTDEKSDEDSSE